MQRAIKQAAPRRFWIVRQVMPSGNESRARINAPCIQDAIAKAAQWGFDRPDSVVLDESRADGR
jgi:hypothetical protein